MTSGTTVGNAVRRPIPFADLVQICGGDRAAVRSVVNAFAEEGCNFLTVTAEIPREQGERDRHIIVDVSHESLIRQWNALSIWLEKEAGVAHEWQRLREDAERGELLTGRRLARALAWREGRDPNSEHETLATADAARIKPNAAWTRLYGGGDFARVEEFTSDSVRADEARRSRRKLTYAAAAAAVVVVLGAAAGGTRPIFPEPSRRRGSAGRNVAG